MNQFYSNQSPAIVFIAEVLEDIGVVITVKESYDSWYVSTDIYSEYL